MMAGNPRPLGPPSERVAANIRRIRREREVTTAALSQRLAVIGHHIVDTGITKTEKGDRRVDVDDLTALALALGVTPNTLLMPQVTYLGSSDFHYLTPEVSGSAEHLWQWAQGERPLPVAVPDFRDWIGNGKHPHLEFSLRTRPYLTAPRPGAGGGGPMDPLVRELASAVLKAMETGATPADVRRVVELAITLPEVMSKGEIGAWLEDGTRPEEES